MFSYHDNHTTIDRSSITHPYNHQFSGGITCGNPGSYNIYNASTNNDPTSTPSYSTSSYYPPPPLLHSTPNNFVFTHASNPTKESSAYISPLSWSTSPTKVTCNNTTNSSISMSSSLTSAYSSPTSPPQLINHHQPPAVAVSNSSSSHPMTTPLKPILKNKTAGPTKPITRRMASHTHHSAINLADCPPPMLTANGKRRGRKPGVNSTLAQRSAANARERSRMRVLSGAFVELKGALPWVPKDTKLSKLDTLKLAAGYIAYLKGVLDNADEEIENNGDAIGCNIDLSEDILGSLASLRSGYSNVNMLNSSGSNGNTLTAAALVGESYGNGSSAVLLRHPVTYTWPYNLGKSCNNSSNTKRSPVFLVASSASTNNNTKINSPDRKVAENCHQAAVNVQTSCTNNQQSFIST